MNLNFKLKMKKVQFSSDCVCEGRNTFPTFRLSANLKVGKVGRTGFRPSDCLCEGREGRTSFPTFRFSANLKVGKVGKVGTFLDTVRMSCKCTQESRTVMQQCVILKLGNMVNLFNTEIDVLICEMKFKMIFHFKLKFN